MVLAIAYRSSTYLLVEKPQNSSMADPSYLAWCREHQVHMHGVQPAYVAEGWRGVVATQELAPGHVVMTVPQDMLMSVLSAQQDPVLSSLLPRQQLSSHQVRGGDRQTRRAA